VSARRLDTALLGVLALLHCLLYVWLIPPWQVPDEPSQFEYAALLGSLGRVPGSADSDPALDARMVESLIRSHFFEYLTGQTPQPPPRSMDEARAWFFMPRQVGYDPPLYFALAALPIGALAGRPIEQQLLAARLLGALFTAGAAVCAYGAGRELFAGSGSRGRALAVGLAVALQPMFVFIGAGVGDDSLANLLGAALCWAALRAARQGLSLRRIAIVVGLALLGLLTKRTLLPWIVLLGLVGLGLAVRWLIHAPIGRAARVAIISAGLVALVGGGWVAIAVGRDPSVARDWYDSTLATLAPRVLAAPATGSPALVVSARHNATQGVPEVAMEWAQNQELFFDARVWSASGTARGRLVIDFGWARTEAPFIATATPQVVRVHTFLPLFCPYLAVGVFADDGTVYVDRLGLSSARRREVALLDNGNLAAAGLRDGSIEQRLAGYARLRELAWGWRSGWLLGPPPLGWALGQILFASFWGQFGWMSLPIVAETPWERGLWLICGGGMIGVVAGLVGGAGAAWRRRAAGLLLALLALALVFPLLNAYTQPRSQAIQQGRYLFPALVPLLLLLVWGWDRFIPPRWRAGALAIWLAWWVLFAATALALLLSVYDPRFAHLHGIFL
jgi:hypothetical protein